MLDNNNLKNNLKYIEIICLVALVVIAFFLVADRQGWLDSEDANTDTEVVAPRGANDIDYSPSTPGDQEAAEDAKQDSEQDSATVDQELSTSLTRASYQNDLLELGSIISEGNFDGTCIFTVTDGKITKETSTKALKNNGSAGCSAKIDASTLDEDSSWEVSSYAVREDGTKSLSDTATILAADR